MDTGDHSPKRRRVRSIWISDIHLGMRGCSADRLLGFLRSSECENLYLVGDIIDLWAMRNRPYWPQTHNDVLRTILGKAKHGTRIIFVPGNHDDLLREYDGMSFGNVQIVDHAIHVQPDGRRLLVIHGDQFDSVVRHSGSIAMIGSRAYGLFLRASALVNRGRRHLGLPYWSLAAFLRHKVKNAADYISSFEQAVAFEAHRMDVDGVVCGHIHRAELRTMDGGILYCNCGDWVESCTALVERYDGRLEILRYTDDPERRLQPSDSPPAVASAMTRIRQSR